MIQNRLYIPYQNSQEMNLIQVVIIIDGMPFRDVCECFPEKAVRHVDHYTPEEEIP